MSKFFAWIKSWFSKKTPKLPDVVKPVDPVKPEPPTAAGYVAKTNLVAKGCTVTTN